MEAVRRVTSSRGAAWSDARLAEIGFGSRMEGYERGRPGYPAALVDALCAFAGLSPGSRVADLAAGTGKLTRQLRAAGPRCVALEPSAAMREVFAGAVDDVPMVAAVAERLPLAGGWADLVTVGQAFHWFDPARTLPEMARILRLGGVLALVWNERDESEPWAAELGRIMADAGNSHEPGAAFAPVVDRSGLFGPSELWRYPHVDLVDRRGLVELVWSRSYVNVLEDRPRAELLGRVQRLAAGLPEPVAVRYVTTAVVARLRVQPSGEGTGSPAKGGPTERGV